MTAAGHVLHVLQPTHGGVANYAAGLIEALIVRDWRVTVVAPPDLTVAGRMRDAGASVHAVPLTRGPSRGDRRAIAAVTRLARTGADVVHAHSTKAGLVGGVAARLAGLPSVYTPHAWAFTMDVSLPERLLYAGFENVMVRGFHGRVVAVSEHERDEARRWRVGGETAVQVIHTGLALPEAGLTRAEARARLGLDPDGVVAAWVGRNHPQKQPGQLAPLARRLGTDARLVALGTELAGSPEAAALTDAGGVVLPDGSDPAVLFAAADLMVLTSAWESFPLVTLEAAAAGLPVVAYAVGGVGEQIRDGETGVLVELDALDSLAGAVRSLAGDPPRRAAMGAAGRALTAERFRPERTTDRVEDLYRVLMGASAARGRPGAAT